MNARIVFSTALLLTAAIATSVAASAPLPRNAGTCTHYIDALPAVLSDYGAVYCLRADLKTSLSSGAAVTVTAGVDVTIDCRGFALRGLAPIQETGLTGILTGDRSDVVRNCGIRGFAVGVHAGGYSDGTATIENNRLEGNSQTGISVGSDAIVRGNRILATGGRDLYNVPIAAIVGGGVIEDNTIDGVSGASGDTTSSSALGIDFKGGVAVNNRIRGLVPTGTGKARGIWIEDQTGLLIADVRDNHVGNVPGSGVACLKSWPRLLVHDNSFANVATAVNVCGDAGGNVEVD